MTAASPQAVLADAAFALLKGHVIARTGLAYYADKDGDLARHLAARLAARLLPDCSAYLGLLIGPDGQAEFDELVKVLTIGETYFFRHAEMFDALRTTVLPALIARNRERRRLRVWSAGCSTGAEAYSVSILLRRDFGLATAGWDLSIVGTDVNREFLARAGEAAFDEWAFRATPDDVRRDCFRPQGRSWVLDERYREPASFQYHNLVADPFPSQLNNLFAFDLILCRNVLIYFDPPQIRRCLDGFHRSLVEGGWLLVGHAEPNVEFFRAFRTVNAHGVVLYQKSEGAPEDWRAGSGSPLSAFPASGVREPPECAAPTLASGGCQPHECVALREARSSGGSRTPLAQRQDSPPPLAPEPTLQQVRAAADRGDWEPALAGCLGLLSAERLSPLPHLYHGLILEQVGRHDEAEAALRRAIYLDRRFALAHYYLGLLLHRTHRDAQGVRSFRNALDLLERLDPGHAFADADGITAAELARLARMQLDVVGA